ncbi:MAG TPA: SRPBCC family protein, partial [Myxococcota bacterium]
MFAVPAAAGDEDGWVRVAEQEGGVLIFSRPHPGSDVQELRVVAIVHEPASVLRNVINDVTHYTELIPYTTRSTLLERDGDRIAVERIELPMLAPREYVVTFTTATHATADGRHTFVTSWKNAPPKYQLLLTARDAVRVIDNTGSWSFEELGDNETRATFEMAVDPAGDVPSALVNVAQRASLPRYVENLRVRARLPQYRCLLDDPHGASKRSTSVRMPGVPSAAM